MERKNRTKYRNNIYIRYMKLEERIGELLKSKNLSLSTAESCTGGSIAALVTSVPGSSEYFNGGIVAYSNEVKMSLLKLWRNMELSVGRLLSRW